VSLVTCGLDSSNSSLLLLKDISCGRQANPEYMPHYEAPGFVVESRRDLWTVFSLRAYSIIYSISPPCFLLDLIEIIQTPLATLRTF